MDAAPRRAVDTRESSPHGRSAPSAGGTRKQWFGRKKIFVTAALLFLAGFGLIIVRSFWEVATMPRRGCQLNLRRLYVAHRKLPIKYRQRPCPMAAVHVVLRGSYLLTVEDSRYIHPDRRDPIWVAYSAPTPEALVCMADPQYACKIGPTFGGALPTEPSYVWCPDPRTLAYCPFHRHALLKDGRIEQR